MLKSTYVDKAVENLITELIFVIRLNLKHESKLFVIL